MPDVVCRSGSNGLRREVARRKSQESVFLKGTGKRSFLERSSKQGLRPFFFFFKK